MLAGCGIFAEISTALSGTISGTPPVTPVQPIVPALANHNDWVTCSSCRFPYARLRGFCPACGASFSPERVVEKPCKIIRKPVANPQFERTLAKRVWLAVASLRRNPIPVIVPAVLLPAAFYWWTVHKSTPNDISAPVAVTTYRASEPSEPSTAPSTSSKPAIPVYGESISHNATSQNAGTLRDPVELWRKVQKGNTGAEIELAKLYLQGTGVAQSCDQARVLLLAAAKKQSSEARNLLTGAYLQRCQ